MAETPIRPDVATNRAAATIGFSAIPQRELQSLLALRHRDPHSILGSHATERELIVREYFPGARSVFFVPDDEPRREMMPRPEKGLFEISLDRRSKASPYRVEVHYSDGHVVTLRSPYTFLPTLGDLDLFLLGEQKHEHPYEKLGAHALTVNGVGGIGFAVWAPNAAGVSVVGDFSGWDGHLNMMRLLGNSGIWEIFVPDLEPGSRYKYEIRTQNGGVLLKTDPYASAMECPPSTASIAYKSTFEFNDGRWMARRQKADPLRTPLSIYEVHLGSWRRVPEENHRSLTYREMADQLVDYVAEMGFTHVELMPVMEHPFTGSWGYQVSGYFAPTARFGPPDDFRYLVDAFHRRSIGVILDWVPAHFPTDSFSLGRFDGTALYEHLDPRQGHNPDWDTYVFNLGRTEVRNFLSASATNWLTEYHSDGLRVDAVSSMLYLDYGRKEGEWIPNVHGGRENLDAISFLQELNRREFANSPGALIVAEESTSWPAVSRPVYVGGLGFNFKWDMGWMHDTLHFFSVDPIFRRYDHHNLTFGTMYAWSENFIMPLSHDEVVYGKRSLIDKMPGDRWQKFANLRSLFGYMWARCGKKLLFMGGEFGQWREWNHDTSLDWHLLAEPDHRGAQNLVRDLNLIYRDEPALWEADVDPAGFRWIDANNADENVIAFMRSAPSCGRRIICVCNFSPVVRYGYRIGAPKPGRYREIMNTDSALYGGSNVGNEGVAIADHRAWHGLPFSLAITLPPLATVWFEVPSD